ncbi:MAG: hypothetical protein RPS47_04815 [Colwellia sp.]|jgi:hypothetical protein
MIKAKRMTTDEILFSCEKLVEEFGASSVVSQIKECLATISGDVLTEKRIASLKQRVTYKPIGPNTNMEIQCRI